MKIFVVSGEYAEDGTYVVAARDQSEVREVLRNYKSVTGAEWDAWDNGFSAEELPGVSAEGAARILWH